MGDVRPGTSFSEGRSAALAGLCSRAEGGGEGERVCRRMAGEQGVIKRVM